MLQWTRQNGQFEIWERIGKDNLFCLARGQIIQGLFLVLHIAEITHSSNCILGVDGCPSLLYQTSKEHLFTDARLEGNIELIIDWMRYDDGEVNCRK